MDVDASAPVCTPRPSPFRPCLVDSFPHDTSTATSTKGAGTPQALGEPPHGQSFFIECEPAHRQDGSPHDEPADIQRSELIMNLLMVKGLALTI